MQTNYFNSLFMPPNVRFFRSFHRSNDNQNATIIFDVMGFVHNFGANKIELNLGGRQHQYLQQFERFVTRLIEAGANLAFFSDGHLQESRNHVWCQRRNVEFTDALDCIASNESTNGKVVARAFLKRRFGCKTIVKSLFKLIQDKNYGQLIVSTHIDCDLAIAKYACESSALAVIASDSDFLIFDGSFQWWHSNSMDMANMTVNCFDRTKLLTLLNLSRTQMTYLATIAGNDQTSDLVRKPSDFIAIADFCRSLERQPCKQIYADIVRFMQIDQRMDRNKAIDCVTKSIESYDLANVNAAQQPTTAIDEYCATNVMMFAFKNQKVFQYDMNFLDFKARNQLDNDYYPIAFTVLDVFRKLAGIMLKNVDHRMATLKIVTKYSLDEEYALKLHTPIYPHGRKTVHVLCLPI